MGILSGAIPRQYDQTPAVQAEKGTYRAYFIGTSDPYTWKSPYPGDKCKGCQGSGKSKKYPQMECLKCGGSGDRIEERIKLRYHLENGLVEEEEMQFKLSPSSTVKDEKGQTVTYSSTTMYDRFSEFSGIQNATPDQLSDWYDAQSQPVKVPIQVVIGFNKPRTALKITAVELRTQRPANGRSHNDQPNNYDDHPSRTNTRQPVAPPQRTNGAGTVPAQAFGRPPATPPANGNWTEPRATTQQVEEQDEEFDEIPF